ncbi:MAG: S9 family peptidase, partial [Bacteroidetes bacterium]|nr:S9 family peptidase [Bacteroidota bacterium]
MSKNFLWPILTFAVLTACDNSSNTNKTNKVDNQTSEKDTITEEMVNGVIVTNYYGTKVKDPYRWLENDTAQNTKEWVTAQNQKTKGYLDAIPYRQALKNRLEVIWNYPKYSAPGKHGNKYYYFGNTGLQAQSVLYVSNSIKGEGKVFLDPNSFSEDGTVSLSGLSFSDDDKYLAYGVASAGSDWVEWRVMEVETKKLLNDHIKWTKFGGASWYKDGFFYTKFPEPKEGEEYSAKNTNGQILYHKLGTKQTDDVLIWEDLKNPSYYNFGRVTEDGQYFVLTQSKGTHGENLKVLRLEGDLTKMPAFVDVITDFDNDHSVFSTKGANLLVKTNRNAPDYKVVEIDLNNVAEENWKEIIPESENTLTNVETGGGRMFLTYLINASERVYV